MPIEIIIRRTVGKLERLPPTLAITTAYLFLALVAAIDYLTGPELILTFFYILPIMLVGWRSGRRLGLATSVLAALLWFGVDKLTADHGNTNILYFNALLRISIFLLVYFAVNAMKSMRVELEALARIDRLTGMANRFQFVEGARLQMKAASRHDSGLSLAYLDVDNFKRINDTFGHAAGDDALREIARVMRDEVRETDLCARIGGDEFAIIFSDADAGRAAVALERIRKGVARLAAVRGWPISLSAGLVSFKTTGGLALDQMLKTADEVMYEAKRAGRDRIHVTQLG